MDGGLRLRSAKLNRHELALIFLRVVFAAAVAPGTDAQKDRKAIFLSNFRQATKITVIPVTALGVGGGEDPANNQFSDSIATVFESCHILQKMW